jgi:hypothetical protein
LNPYEHLTVLISCTLVFFNLGWFQSRKRRNAACFATIFFLLPIGSRNKITCLVKVVAKWNVEGNMFVLNMLI